MVQDRARTAWRCPGGREIRISATARPPVRRPRRRCIPRAAPPTKRYNPPRTEQCHGSGLAHLVYFTLAVHRVPAVWSRPRAGLLIRRGERAAAHLTAFVGGSGPAGFNTEPLSQFDSPNRPPALLEACATRRRRRPRRLEQDFGEGRRRRGGVRRSTERPAIAPDRLPLRGAARRRADRAAGGAPPALGLDRRGALRGERLGRRPHDRLGLRRAGLGAQAGARHRDVGGEPLRHRHRRLQHLRPGPEPHAGAARALDPARRVFGRDAQILGSRCPHTAGRRCSTRRSCRSGGATRMIHTQLLPVHPRRRRPLPRDRPAADAHRLSRPRPTRAPWRPTISSSWPDLLAAAGRDRRAHERASLRAAGRWIDWWRSVRFKQGDRPVPAGPRACSRAAASTRCPPRPTSCRSSRRRREVLPLLSADVDTLAPYGGKGSSGSPTARTASRCCIPARRWKGRMFESERLASAASGSSWRCTDRGEPPPRLHGPRLAGRAGHARFSPVRSQARVEAPRARRVRVAAALARAHDPLPREDGRAQGHGVPPVTERARLVGINHVALDVRRPRRGARLLGAVCDVELRWRVPGMAFLDMGDQSLALAEGRTQPPDPSATSGCGRRQEAAPRAREEAGAEIVPGRGLKTSADPWGQHAWRSSSTATCR